MNFALIGFIPVSEVRRRQRSWGRVQAPNSRNKATRRNTNFNFRAYHSLIKWDAYDVEYTASNERRCHPDRQNSSRVHPGNRAEVFKFLACVASVSVYEERDFRF